MKLVIVLSIIVCFSSCSIKDKYIKRDFTSFEIKMAMRKLEFFCFENKTHPICDIDIIGGEKKIKEEDVIFLKKKIDVYFTSKVENIDIWSDLNDSGIPVQGDCEDLSLLFFKEIIKKGYSVNNLSVIAGFASNEKNLVPEGHIWTEVLLKNKILVIDQDGIYEIKDIKSWKKIKTRVIYKKDIDSERRFYKPQLILR